jgi:hypothetical protein
MRLFPGRSDWPDSVIDVLDAQQLAARRRNRRRLAVFGGVAALCLLAGQAWNYARPDEYRASLRLRLQLAGPGAAAASSPVFGLADMARMLDSRALIEPLARTMAAAGQPLATDADAAVARLQTMLQVQPLADGEVLLQAIGTPPALLAAVLNAWPALIRAELMARQTRGAEARLAEAQQALAQLAQAVGERRRDLAQVRSRAGMQAERDGNGAVAQQAGQTVALDKALETRAAAQARLQALRDAAAAAFGSVMAPEHPALAALEVRASLAREELRDMAHTSTAGFMASDPQAQALRSELARLERQIARQRGADASPAVGEAEAALAAAQAQVARLSNRQTAARPAMQAVPAWQAQARVLEDDLARLEGTRHELLDRVARLAAQGQRTPAVTVLSPAIVPAAPFRPDHRRATLWVLGGSVLAGLLAVGLMALFDRPPHRAPNAGRATPD